MKQAIKLIITFLLSGRRSSTFVSAFEYPNWLLPARLRSQPTTAVCSRRGILGELAVGAVAASCLVIAPSQSVAATPGLATDVQKKRRQPPSARAAIRFENEYNDDLHPGCDRRIELVDPLPSQGINTDRSFLVTFSGTDVGPDGVGPIVKLACTEETIAQYKLRSWSFDGRVSYSGTDIDAGDGIHVGTWHVATESQPWTGIRWADGNRWTVKEQQP